MISYRAPYSETTDSIQIEVEPFFIPERSLPQKSIYVFAYKVRISNQGQLSCQLLKRHWIIRDGLGQVEHVQGEGVVGETPYLRSGESFEYTSFCPLKTPTGNMRGRYEMIDDNGRLFQAKIPVFFLRTDTALH